MAAITKIQLPGDTTQYDLGPSIDAGTMTHTSSDTYVPSSKAVATYAVAKSGDTMTGNLTAPNFGAKGTYPKYNFTDSDGNRTGCIQIAASNHRFMFKSDSTDTEFGDIYYLPYPSTDLTADKTYSILTTKSAVTVAQGGTGAATAAAARENLHTIYRGGDTMTGPLGVPKIIVNNDNWNGINWQTEGNNTFTILTNPENGRVNFNTRPLGTTTDTGYDRYLFPEPTNHPNTDNWYRILTTKDAVAIAEGGTGATTAKAARTNLELPTMEFGTSESVTVNAGTTADVTINFTANKFSATPKVIATVATGYKCSCAVINTNTNSTKTVVRVLNHDSQQRAVVVNWIAVR